MGLRESCNHNHVDDDDNYGAYVFSNYEYKIETFAVQTVKKCEKRKDYENLVDLCDKMELMIESIGKCESLNEFVEKVDKMRLEGVI